MPGYNCHRCGEHIRDHWADRWPNYGAINMGYHSQIFSPITRISNVQIDSWDLCREHPAITDISSAQEVTFKWGHSYKYGEEADYRMCRQCQEKLLNLLGEFFQVEG